MGCRVTAGELCCPTCTVNKEGVGVPSVLRAWERVTRAEPCPLAQLAAAMVDFASRRKGWVLLEHHDAFGTQQPFPDPFEA